MKSALVAFSIVALVFSPAYADDFRVFTSAQGVAIKAKLVGIANGQVTIVREDGRQFTLPVTALSAADQDFLKTAPAPTAARPSSAAGLKPAPSPNDKVSAEDVNAVVGQALFGEMSLWDMPAGDVAAKLALPPESKTKNQSSFRSYPKEDFKMFGARPYSVALYAEKDKVTSLSLVFANKGDLFGAAGSGQLHFDKDTPPEDAAKITKQAMDIDLKAITSTLSAKLGEPKKERFGEGKVGRMNMQRWDWRGHAVLLAEAEGEYVGVQIVTTAFADEGGKVARMSDAIVRDQALANLQKRENGDVVIGDIPMVDQGPKGYCVPATAERAMRYLGVSADMYILANAGESGYGGGTSVEMLLMGVGRHIRAKGRSFDSWDGPMKMKDLTKILDKGVPVIWALFSTDEFNNTANARTAKRKTTTDWAAWKTQVTAESQASVLPKDKETGHVVLIIGYNKETNEIAFSDSWGERFIERWITIPEAEQVSQGRFYVIGF